jgi:hypothetical protein
VQTDILDRGPDNRETTGFRREHVNLIGALPHIAEQAFDGIGGLNVSMRRLRELVKRQQVFFVLSQASYGFGIALSVLGECSRPVGPWPPAYSLAPKCQRVQLARPHALVLG